MNTQNSGKTLKNLRLKTQKRMFEFSNSENLINCIIMLYRKKKLRKLECEIYKTSNKYIMILKSAKNCLSNVYAKEFSENHTESLLEICKTEEYGILLTKENTITRFGEIFSPKI